MTTALHKKALRDLRRRLPQVAAIGATVMLGVLLFVASYDSFRNVQASYDRTYARTHFADLTVTGGDSDTIAAAARNVPGVERVATRTQADRPMTIGATKLMGRVVGIPPANGHAINEIDLITVRLPDPTSYQVVVERHTADTFGLTAGKSVRVFDDTAWRDVTVSGVVQSPEYLWPARNRQDLLGDPHAFAVVFAPESLARTLSARTTPNQTLVEMTGSATESDRDRVTRLLRSAGAMDIQDRGDQPSNAALRQNFNGFRVMAIGLPATSIPNDRSSAPSSPLARADARSSGTTRGTAQSSRPLQRWPGSSSGEWRLPSTPRLTHLCCVSFNVSSNT